MFTFLQTFILVGLGLLGLTLAGCETFHGAGRDIENAGESIQKS
jgi:predicted small secreted protein